VLDDDTSNGVFEDDAHAGATTRIAIATIANRPWMPMPTPRGRPPRPSSETLASGRPGVPGPPSLGRA
jgi:hypothetical protein